MATRNLQVRIRKFPSGEVEAAHFDVVERPAPDIAEGEVLVRTLYLSLDPYMRKRLADAVAGRVQFHAGDLMPGRTVGEVVESRDARFAPGDHVLGWGGWQQFSAEDAGRLEKIEHRDVPLSAHLGALGRPGITAWLGIVHVANVQAGEQVLVSSAAGAVGSFAAQIARQLGARVTGIAGGPGKCAAVVEELRVQACVDYKSANFEAQLREATPHGVDACFENVGGQVMDAALDRMNVGGRIALCGLMSQYHSGVPYPMKNFPRLLDRALSLRGFRIDDHAALYDRAREDLARWVRAGELRQWETVAEGLERAPAAFAAMLAGSGRGKTIVRV